MKNILQKTVVLSLCAIVLFSCDSRETQPADTVIATEPTPPEETESLYTDRAFNQWKMYYSERDVDMTSGNFELDNTIDVVPENATSAAMWEPGFDPVYLPYLAFNADSSMYVDIHSYKWKAYEGEEIAINPDQEVMLVNRKDKTKKRLFFYGPTFWVEDAYFKNDSIVVLMENNDERLPAYQELNIRTMKSDYYVLKESVNFDSDYLNRIVTRRGIKP
ncbi:MAG: hypothetical protein Q4F57_05820 [Weeksellaceae bacterium]|nr:hypothetical protein [Weeksellaceae bacterium]